MPIIHFSVEGANGDITPVSYDSSMIIRDFLLDYLKKYTDYVSLDTKIYVFRVGIKILNSNKFINGKIGELIREGSIVTFQRKQDVHYSGGFMTIDVSKNQTKEIEPGYTQLSYRQTCYGLNIQSKCKNRNCEAYNDIIYIPIGYVENWSLSGHFKDQVLCPSCKKMVKAINYYFIDCYYKIEYIKEDNEEIINKTIDGYASHDKFKTFDEASGNANFVDLIFTVTKR